MSVRSPLRHAWPVVLLIAAVLSGCSDPEPREPVVPATSGSPTPGPSASSSPVPGASASRAPVEPAATNDLRAGNRAQRSLRAAPLTADVQYSTTLPVANWQPAVTKPLRVSLTAINNRSKGQKIYLSRVTATVSAYDESGLVDGPRAITDTANVSPGYYVTFPTDYGQTLLLPALDPAAIRLTVDFTYEFVLQVSESKTNNQRDFAKQTATDRITVPLA